MVKSLLAFLALGLLILFGYFFVNAGGSGSERTRGAAARVGDTVVDEGFAGVVRARLAARYGLDGVRFLHVHNDNGQVLVYGLLPPTATADDIAAAVRGVPGVTAVDVRVVERPEHVKAHDAPSPAPVAHPAPSAPERPRRGK